MLTRKEYEQELKEKEKRLLDSPIDLEKIKHLIENDIQKTLFQEAN